MLAPKRAELLGDYDSTVFSKAQKMLKEYDYVVSTALTASGFKLEFLTDWQGRQRISGQNIKTLEALKAFLEELKAEESEEATKILSFHK